jgi:hypothetical protein
MGEWRYISTILDPGRGEQFYGQKLLLSILIISGEGARGSVVG